MTFGRRLTLALTLACAVGAVVASNAAQAQVDVSVAWKGDQPTGVDLSGLLPRARFKLNDDKTAYESRIALAVETAYLQSLSLDAAYGGDTVLSVPIRLWPKLGGLSVTVYQVKITKCSMSDLTVSERAAGTVPAALKAFFTARALYLLEGDDRCSPNNRQRAAKAWFDRAYELTLLANFFDLSPEAAAAYLTYDPAYVKKYQDQAKGAAMRLIIQERTKAHQAGEFDQALVLNNALLDTFRNDPGSADIGRRLQGLNAAQLAADGDNIAGSAARAGQPVSGLTAKLQLSPQMVVERTTQQ